MILEQWFNYGGVTLSETVQGVDICEEKTSDPSAVEAARARVPDESRALAEFFRILGDETRCRIAFALGDAELCVCEIAETVGSSISNVSHHLRLLKTSRLVKYRKVQRRVFYSLDDEHVKTLLAQGLEHMKHR